MEKCLHPNYTEHFKCDGAICGSYCCREWKITVDKKTYAKYAAIRDEKTRKAIMANIVENDGVYVIKLLEDGRCPFLLASGLCRLQKDYGEDYLPDICHEYPRVTYRLNEGIEQSLTDSCPIAAGLILKSREPLDFGESDFALRRESVIFDMRKKIMPLADYAIDLQGAGISILQDRRFDMDERLFAVREFFASIDDIAAIADENSRRAALNAVLNAKYIAAATAEAAKKIRQKIFDDALYIHDMTELFGKLYGMERDAEKEKNLLFVYRGLYGAFYRSILTDLGHIIENHNANMFFLRLYPYAYNGSFAKNSDIFIESCKMTEFALFVTAAKTGGKMSAETLVDTIRHLNERLDHSRDAMRCIRESPSLDKAASHLRGRAR